jgi:hypothetical protein
MALFVGWRLLWRRTGTDRWRVASLVASATAIDRCAMWSQALSPSWITDIFILLENSVLVSVL